MDEEVRVAEVGVSVAEANSSLVQGKFAPPALGGSALERRRIADLIHHSLSTHRIVQLIATAGSGKTTAVLHAAAEFTEPVAWLTLDRLDVSPGRLLTYLEAAVLSSVKGVPRVASEALGKGVAHSDAAALLAEAVKGHPLILVIDELERIEASQPSLETLRSFIRYSGSSMRFVVTSRRDIDLAMTYQDLGGETRTIGETALAFTVDEARSALDRLGRPTADSLEAVRATKGWVTGVLFESYRSTHHVDGAGGEADPLHTYLSSEIMSSLPAEVQDALIDTSLLPDVSVQSAEALGVRNAAASLAVLRSRHLPLEFIDRNSFRCLPRFREYLFEVLAAKDAARRARLHGAYADLLLRQGRKEEALEEYLLASRVDDAERVGSDILLPVVRRLDTDLAHHWLQAFRREVVHGSVPLTAAELLVALEREEYACGAECADRLLRLTKSTEADSLESEFSGVMAWCYFLAGRIEDAQDVLRDAEDTPQVSIMRFAVGVELVDDPTHYRDRPAESGAEVDGMLARVDLAHGRLESLISHSESPYAAIRQSRLAAMVGLGQLEEAGRHYAASTQTGWTQIRLQVEFLAECGQPEEAWSQLIDGRDHLARSGSVLYRMFASLTEAMLALRFTKDTALARAALQAAARVPTASRRIRVVEQLALWYGLIGLLEHDDAFALERLREAVGIMTYWDRLLLLPRAAVYLAEAEWRNNNEDESDRAADLALRVADEMGSRHALIQALREFPNVLSRRLDLETEVDSPWHEIGAALLVAARATKPPGAGVVHAVQFGTPALRINGRLHELKFIKSHELLGFLASRGGSAERSDVIEALFESKNTRSAQAYLRIAANSVRILFPGQQCLITDGPAVAWTAGELASDYTEYRRQLLRLHEVSGERRAVLALELIDRLPSGEFLPGARSQWVLEERQRWSKVALDIRQAAAQAAFSVSDYALSHQLLAEVLAMDPYRESAWRLQMHIASALGDGDGVITAYRECRDALRDVPTVPANSTRNLLERLRA